MKLPIKKAITLSTAVISLLFTGVSLVYAHVVVKPSEVGVAAFQTFTISLPVEKDIPTTNLRLIIPDGIKEVTPTVKSGWNIELKKEGSGDVTKTTEIVWSGGVVPPERRDDFTFSAQAPTKATTLHWKAYQTYQDGSVVSWDQEPKGDDEAFGNKGPYSETKVVNDLASSPAAGSAKTWSVVAIIIAVISLGLSQTKKG